LLFSCRVLRRAPHWQKLNWWGRPPAPEMCTTVDLLCVELRGSALLSTNWKCCRGCGTRWWGTPDYYHEVLIYLPGRGPGALYISVRFRRIQGFALGGLPSRGAREGRRDRKKHERPPWCVSISTAL